MIAAALMFGDGENGMQGTVKWFNNSKGFGFIGCKGGKDVFVHATVMEAAGIHTLSEGDRVSFDVQQDTRGAKAVNLKSA